MSDDTSQDSAGLQISDDLKAKYPDLIALILASESMNNEERQYWVNILPIMTPDQVQNLRDILQNEKDQLAAIDKKYSTELTAEAEGELIAKTESDRHARRNELQQKEEQFEQKEEQETEQLLERIENL